MYAGRMHMGSTVLLTECGLKLKSQSVHPANGSLAIQIPHVHVNIHICTLTHTHTHTVNINRVVLDNAYSSPGGEYINASFVTGYYHHQEFIVTQHPLTSTREDFWRMILERNIATIVTIGPVTDTNVRSEREI